ncbi:MAG: hypothetical protein R3E08_04140 [Thiotrichaceae bacterium]
MSARRYAIFLMVSNTAYANTIPRHLEEHTHGDLDWWKLRSFIRWNTVGNSD